MNFSQKSVLYLFFLLYCKGLEIISKGTFKQLKRNINNLIDSEDTENSDKQILEKNLKTLKDLELIYIKDVDNEKILPKFVSEIKKIRNVTETINEKSEKRRKDRFIQGCTEEIILGFFKTAVTKLYMIDINQIPIIVSQVYRKGHFKLLIKFSDEIPSLKLTFEIYKALNNSVGPEESLSLISNIGKNVIFQYSVSHDLKEEAYRLIDYLKMNVIDWIVEKFKKAVELKHEDKELSRICDAITYDIKDLKFLREISDIAIPQNLTDNQDILKIIQNMGKVTKISFLNYLFYQFSRNHLIDGDSIIKMIDLKNFAYKEYNNLTSEYKKIIDVYGLPNLRYRVAQIFSVAFKVGYYDLDNLTDVILKNDRHFFNDVIDISLDGVKDEDLIEVIDLFHDRTLITKTLVFQTIFKNMGKRGANDSQIGAYMKLESVITDTLEDENLKNVEVEIVSELKTIQFEILNFNNDIFNLLKDSLKKGNINQNHTSVLKMAFEANSEYFCTEFANLYGKINTEKLINYIMEFFPQEEKIKTLILLQDNIILEELYFKMASCYKIIKENPNYINISSFSKLSLETAIMELPFSIRSTIFGKEFYLKSRKSEYLGLSDKINNTRQLYTLKDGSKGNGCRWIFEETDKSAVFKIKNSYFNEYLVAGSREGYSREVFSSENGNDWRLVLTQGGVYIKNAVYNEYLNTGKKNKNRFKRFVYTFPPNPQVKLTVWTIKEIFYDFL